MAFKINIGDKSGKTYKLEADAPALIDKELKSIIQGKDINSDLEGYEFEISGASDNAGFPALEKVEGIGLKRILLTYGKGMKKRPKYEGKKKRNNNRPKGLRLRKGVRGKVISEAITQINLKVVKAGNKPLEEIFNPKTEEASEAPKEE